MMILETTITIKPEQENNQNLLEKLVIEKILSEKKFTKQEKDFFYSSKKTFVLRKKSIDARKSNVKFHLRYSVFVGEDFIQNDEFLPKWKKVNEKSKKVIVVGSGPAGLFASLKLLENGIKPIVLERGSTTSKRKVDIANISKTGIVNENSNYCFGEGGAGTFSDGKLYTRSNKRGNIEEILKIFVYHGADKKILTDSHAHIGTDKLPKIVNNIVKTILDFGGEVYFDTCVSDFIIEKNLEGELFCKGVVCGEKEIFSDTVLLATGHSATDIYEKLFEIEKKFNLDKILQEKTFAVGVRVEHPRSIIDKIQYHGKERNENLPAAEYRLVTQVENRGVYSFCMCPGGNVVPSQSGSKSIVVNGMSCSSRNSFWSNAAIVVEIFPEDAKKMLSQIGIECEEKLSSLKFRTWLENETFLQGQNQKAPSQLLIDFLNGKKTQNFPKTSYTPGVISSRLDLWLPEFISSRLKIAFKDFDSKMKGFICKEAVLIASETRTSTPLRILRDKETYESLDLKHLFPCGEGSGYAGGITSSAMDGINSALKISELLN